MEKLNQLNDKLISIVENIKKTINRPYKEEYSQLKLDEVNDIILQAKSILSSINIKYLESAQVEQLKLLRDSICLNSSYAREKLNFFLEHAKTEEADKQSTSSNTEQKSLDSSTLQNLTSTTSEISPQSSTTNLDTITEFDSDPNVENKLENRSKNSESKDNIKKMAEFNITTATSLLPKLDGTEESVQNLVDAIEMYDELLNNASKATLVSFVLKTRLDQASKLRLNATYAESKALILDIKKFLLTKKSATSLTSQLNSSKQNNKTINEFGKEIEELFVNLTISQANDDKNAFKILKPTNEKIAIDSFSKGLKSPELRTIIRARNYATLNEAIRGALDEEKSSPKDEQILNFRKYPNKNKGHFKNRKYKPFKPFNKYYKNQTQNQRGKFGKNYFNKQRGGRNFRKRNDQHVRHMNEGDNTRRNTENNNDANTSERNTPRVNSEEDLQFFRA